MTALEDLRANRFLEAFQCGFRPGYITETVLVTLAVDLSAEPGWAWYIKYSLIP